MGEAVGPFFKGGYLTQSILEKYSFRNAFKLALREARKLQYSYCTLCEVKNWVSRMDGVTGEGGQLCSKLSCCYWSFQL